MIQAGANVDISDSNRGTSSHLAKKMKIELDVPLVNGLPELPLQINSIYKKLRTKTS